MAPVSKARPEAAAQTKGLAWVNHHDDRTFAPRFPIRLGQCFELGQQGLCCQFRTQSSHRMCRNLDMANPYGESQSSAFNEFSSAQSLRAREFTCKSCVV